MTESTGYLDMNKKKTCVIQIKSINSLLFCRRRRCCCPPTPPSHRIGIGKKRGVSNLGIDKNPIGIKPLYEPQPFEPAIPFFSTNWSAVSHPSQRVIPIRHVSVTKCPLFADLSPRSPFPRPVSGFPNKNT